MMDFHCHLDLYPNAKQVYFDTLQRCEFIWLVTTSPKAYIATSRVLPSNEKLFISPGLHPEIADKKLDELKILLSQMKFCGAVGEIGLDGRYRHQKHFAKQKYIFQTIVKNSAKLGGRVLNIHSRSAAQEVLDILDQYPGFGTAILHWFTDDSSLLQRAIASGCWFSVGPAMLESANGRKLVQLIPRDRVVFESDGPFARINGVPVMPWNANTVTQKLSKIWNVSTDEVFTTFKSNGLHLITLLKIYEKN